MDQQQSALRASMTTTVIVPTAAMSQVTAGDTPVVMSTRCKCLLQCSASLYVVTECTHSTLWCRNFGVSKWHVWLQ